MLFKGSLLENLRYAAPAVGEAEVLEAARRAEVAAFAETLPGGYATDVGTAGRALSGGQRQRIAIAALPEDPLVLVLDEATSTVNEATAARIIRAVDALFAGHTRIVISHRTAQIRPTVRAADGRLLPSAGRAPPT